HVVAIGDPARVLVVVVAVLDHAGPDASVVADVLPQAVRPGHVAAAAGLDPDGVAVVAAHGHHDAVAVDRRSVDQGIETAASPQHLAGGGIEGFHFHRETHHQFLAVPGLHDDGRAERADHPHGALLAEAVGPLPRFPSRFVPLPHGFAGLLVESVKHRVFGGAV